MLSNIDGYGVFDVEYLVFSLSGVTVYRMRKGCRMIKYEIKRKTRRKEYEIPSEGEEGDCRGNGALVQMGSSFLCPLSQRNDERDIPSTPHTTHSVSSYSRVRYQKVYNIYNVTLHHHRQSQALIQQEDSTTRGRPLIRFACHTTNHANPQVPNSLDLFIIPICLFQDSSWVLCAPKEAPGGAWMGLFNGFSLVAPVPHAPLHHPSL